MNSIFSLFPSHAQSIRLAFHWDIAADNWLP
uniref:Uncharacterized protein n=1 Tax=Anguilla anguilla TaxID=7936 RepID=A0A0E9S3D7_ANGAN